MNATHLDDSRTQTESIAGPDRLMLYGFLFFIFLIAAFIVGDLIGAFFRS